ncbi:uncharacterized protein N7484_009693 [Penicillium longicatenatum]|uniref:uncharacterized protein n=1 Tax=Penicillium longicatenatum TaxID=1561947 RepID=UPI0025479694|nr:uncharacterized protein N7484_009693 [Penicillium longicatenatum]KAJ5636380.1 hypothetical protein N7484_009693 [Penicillium longicatenatum]
MISMEPPALSVAISDDLATAVEFKTYETSVAIIERTGWRIQQPIPWTKQSEKGAISFLSDPSPRDKRKLLKNNRFRILLVETPNTTTSYQLTTITTAAKAVGYITERFDFFLKNDTAGSAILEDPATGINFIAQTPQDDGYPFFALSLNHRPQESHSRGIDWECLLFVRPSSLWHDSAEHLLCHDPFPHDSPAPIPADLMVLPVVLLSWQVEQIMTEVNDIKRALVAQYRALVIGEIVQLEELRRARDELFRTWQKNLFLKRRWDFAQELAGNLLIAFGLLERRYLHGPGSNYHEMIGAQGVYSPTLMVRVSNQKAILKSVIHDIDTTASRIESQQKLVDDQTNAVTIFSMGFFNWNMSREDGGSSAVVSNWIGLYFALSVALTLIVVIIWKVVSQCEERKRKKIWAGKIV